MTEAIVRAAFDKQAGWCRLLGAGFTADLCTLLGQLLDRTTTVGARVLDWPGEPFDDALVLRLTGGLNALVRSGALPPLAAHYPPAVPGDGLADALRAALAHPGLAAWLESAPQTNEVARSGVLMPGLQAIAAETGLPLALFELGASAGLNLRLDSYAYDLGGSIIEPHAAPLRLAPKWQGPPPPDAEVFVVARCGVDLNPLDAADAGHRDRLLAYVWPEQAERVARLSAALAAAALDPPPVDRGDAAAWVEAKVAPVVGRCVVVLHSIASQYFPAETRTRIALHLEAQGALATATAPLAWLRYELDSAEAGAMPTLRLRLWPGGDDRLLAYAHPHGASITWLA